MPTEAGQGEHHVYRIASGATEDGIRLTRGKHYLGVDAVAWYINKKSTWFSDRLASGTLELRAGLEKYQAALGTYELKDGAKFAPVFERPVLPDRNYVGGSIGLNASLTAIKQNTAIGGMLKSAASASLGVVAGMVQTATLAGPAKILAAAGEDLIGGVKKVLSDTADNREPIFDFSGLDYTLKPDDIYGPEVFLLLHRGASLNERVLNVKTSGQLVLPYLGDDVLNDGAWLLLRFRRSDEYSGVRDWFDRARALRNRFDSLVSDVSTDITPKDEALKALKPSGTGDTTIFDEFARLRSVILNDGVLSEREAGLYVGKLVAALAEAKRTIVSHNGVSAPGAPSAVEQFRASLKSLNVDLSNGAKDHKQVGTVFVKGYSDFVAARRLLVKKGAGMKASQVSVVVKPTPTAVFADMRHLPNALRRV